MLVFGGFDGNFLRDMHYAQLQSFQLKLDLDKVYSDDIQKLVNNKDRADIEFLVQDGEDVYDVIYGHSFYLVFRLISMANEFENEEVPSMILNILRHCEQSRSPAKVLLPEKITRKFVNLLHYIYDPYYVANVLKTYK